MAATARASSKTSTTATGLVLALTLALVLVPADGNGQCAKYPLDQLRNMLTLLKDVVHAPVGKAAVDCSDKAKECLMKKKLLMRSGSCELLGGPCKLQDGSPGAVRASLDEWRAAGRLVGECAPPPRCNATHVLVRRHWLAPAGRCVPVGQLLCACACQSPPPSPFPDCDCDRGPSLQPAPFGGYECAHTCHGTCSPQIGRPRGSCAFPPLAVHPLAVERPDEVSRRSPILGRMYHHLRDNEGCVLKTDAPRANSDPQRLNPYISRRDVVAPQASAAELRAERSEYPFLSE
ncbi:hypothetical protein R5R35_006423 [Gryllus longicercus]|uniref:Uncharacterized protein n=1 Tax=Gryllus longicercus TaxID=2509291 RepID=A0AAN9VWV8_9ORTH